MSNKHDANVRKSTLVNFQIGLIASLLFTYVMFEIYTTKPIPKVVVEQEIPEETYTAWDEQFKLYEEPVEKEIAQKQSAPIPDPTEFEVIEDDVALEDIVEEFKHTEPETTTNFDLNTLIETDDLKDEPTEVPFILVEEVPIFPGCEKLKTKKEKAACFNEKIGKIISRKFNSDLGSKYGLSGIQKIYTVFDVATDGTIQNVRVRAPHPKLKKEAERVIGLFPKMTPGMQRKQPVTVKYQLPIVFQIQE